MRPWTILPIYNNPIEGKKNSIMRYLTRQEKANMLNELSNQGFNKEKMKIDCTSSVQSYGNKIYLNVKYDYDLNLPFSKEIIVPMEISRVSVSKRWFSTDDIFHY